MRPWRRICTSVAAASGQRSAEARTGARSPSCSTRTSNAGARRDPAGDGVARARPTVGQGMRASVAAAAVDLRQGRVPGEVDDEDRSADERRVRLERERRAERCQGLGERECLGAYRVPSASSARSTRRRSFPVSL